MDVANLNGVDYKSNKNYILRGKVMLYKEAVCPKCKGYGFISHYDENSVCSESCQECSNGIIVVPMTNSDVIKCCNNEQLAKVYINLGKWAIYSGGNNNRLLYQDNVEDFELWLNKETDKIDLETIFDFIDEKDYEHPYLKTVCKSKI